MDSARFRLHKALGRPRFCAKLFSLACVRPQWDGGRFLRWMFISLISSSAVCSHALTIISGPTFTPAPNAPLAGTLQVSTDVPSRVSVSVYDGTNTWQRHFYSYAKSNAVTLLGFKPNRTNEITVTARDRFRNTATSPMPLKFVTAALPADFPTIVLLTNQPAKMESGYTLLRATLKANANNRGYVIAVDNSGEVVWYMVDPSPASMPPTVVRQLDSGNLLILVSTGFLEVNMLGQTVRTRTAPAVPKLNLHEAIPSSNGTIFYLVDSTRTVTNYPTSVTNSNAPTTTRTALYQSVAELSATNATTINTWSLYDMLDPTRVSFIFSTVGNADIEHANALTEDPQDGSFIVSVRTQNAVIKFSRSGQLKWILGPHDNWKPQYQQYLLTPVGAPFEWNFAQHAPEITPQGTLLIHDNGNYRASPFAPVVPPENTYNRAVEYSIDEANMTVSQVWEFGRTNGQSLFSPIVGSANWLPKRENVLVTHGSISYVNGLAPSSYSPTATMVRIREVTHETSPEVVFDLALFDYGNTNSTYKGCYTYRSARIPGLYSSLGRAVQDLVITCGDGKAHLTFSGDETRSYAIEASTNLVDWEQLEVIAEGVDGEFEFEDFDLAGFPRRYYRVITQ